MDTQIYIHKSGLIEEVRKRQAEGWEERAEEWRKNNRLPPSPLANLLSFNEKNSPFICIARHIATWREEDKSLAEVAQKLGLIPCWLTFNQDRFVSQNPDKKNLVILPISWPDTEKGKKGLVRLRIADIRSCEGKCLSDIFTYWGENLVGFHQKIRENGREHIVVDLSSTLKALGGAKKYYPWFISLFVGGIAVLYEDFHSSIYGLEEFYKRVVTPALEEIKASGLPPPLILQIPPREDLEYFRVEEVFPHLPLSQKQKILSSVPRSQRDKLSSLL